MYLRSEPAKRPQKIRVEALRMCPQFNSDERAGSEKREWEWATRAFIASHR